MQVSAELSVADTSVAKSLAITLYIWGKKKRKKNNNIDGADQCYHISKLRG